MPVILWQQYTNAFCPDWLPVMNKPPQRGLWKEPWIGTGLIPNGPPGALTAGPVFTARPPGLCLRSPPASVQSVLSGAHPLTSPHMQLYSHFMSNTLCLDSPSALCFLWLCNARQTSAHLSNPTSDLLFQEAILDNVGHTYTCRTVHTPLSRHSGY